ncbi:phosphatase PAP2 family protein [Mucilaginibacter sp. UR6-1]|uniref:phosphatase PAP2 family protein n=1 Tax=Mucilaginibacter sp. UR6-1 TaxID=1435643 RepID=UPI001E501AA2|nr:phosphatase PAP2 family protein [Mucilaginibacter sp. UR6-1]MCC8409761.1 phosphatase PAP2 family protein [Mucilaginibacter sp. UR6-1]
MNIGIKGVLRRIDVFFILYLLFLIICLSLKLIYTREEIYFAVNSRYSEVADLFFRFYTNIGDGLFTIAIVVVLILFFSYSKAFLLASSYAVSSLIAQALKFAFDAPRPKLYFAEHLQNIHFVKDVHIYLVHSFPSGHSVTAFSTAVVLTYFSRKKAWGMVFFILAVFAGYSRMYLSEHFFEDVVAGSVTGVIVTVLWLSFIDSKQFLHSPKWQNALLKKRSA